MSKLISSTKIKIKPKVTLSCSPPPVEVEITEVLENIAEVQETPLEVSEPPVDVSEPIVDVSEPIVDVSGLAVEVPVEILEEMTQKAVVSPLKPIIDQTQLSPLVMKGTKKCSPRKKASPKRTSPKKPKSKKNSFEKTNFPPKVLLHSVDQFQAKLEKFSKMPFYAQKSEGWLKQRCEYLTASSIGHAIAEPTNVARQELLLDKVSYGTHKPFRGGVATQWGNKYEPVANAIYSYRNQVTIEEFAMITNEKYPILGISPDGILPDRMIEIKCPYSRNIDGKIKPEYYHQMQEQMAVCEYDMCDFVEVKLKEINSELFWIDFKDWGCEKGITFMYIDLLEKDAEKDGHTIKYIYSPMEYYDQYDQMEKWYNDQLKAFQKSTSQLYIDESYWVVDKYNCQLVYRHEDWIPYFYPVLEDFWKEVVHYRKVGLDQCLKDLASLKGANSPQGNQIQQLDYCCFSDDGDDEVEVLPPNTKQGQSNTKQGQSTNKCLL